MYYYAWPSPAIPPHGDVALAMKCRNLTHFHIWFTDQALAGILYDGQMTIELLRKDLHLDALLEHKNLKKIRLTKKITEFSHYLPNQLSLEQVATWFESEFQSRGVTVIIETGLEEGDSVCDLREL